MSLFEAVAIKWYFKDRFISLAVHSVPCSMQCAQCAPVVGCSLLRQHIDIQTLSESLESTLKHFRKALAMRAALILLAGPAVLSGSLKHNCGSAAL